MMMITTTTTNEIVGENRVCEKDIVKSRSPQQQLPKLLITSVANADRQTTDGRLIPQAERNVVTFSC